MSNSISIAYPAENAAQITVTYSIEQVNDIQTISCSIEGKTFPIWLQLRKFSISSVKTHGSYSPLYNDLNNSKNMDTSLFIDLAYTSIMKVERFKCA